MSDNEPHFRYHIKEVSSQKLLFGGFLAPLKCERVFVGIGHAILFKSKQFPSFNYHFLLSPNILIIHRPFAPMTPAHLLPSHGLTGHQRIEAVNLLGMLGNRTATAAARGHAVVPKRTHDSFLLTNFLTIFRQEIYVGYRHKHDQATFQTVVSHSFRVFSVDEG